MHSQVIANSSQLLSVIKTCLCYGFGTSLRVHGNHDIGHMGLKLSWQTFTNLICKATITTQNVSIFHQASYPNISLSRKRAISVLITYISLWKPSVKYQTNMKILITNLLGPRLCEILRHDVYDMQKAPTLPSHGNIAISYSKSIHLCQ